MLPPVNRPNATYPDRSVNPVGGENRESDFSNTVSSVANSCETMSATSKNKSRGESHGKPGITDCVNEKTAEIPEPDYDHSESNINDSYTMAVSANSKNSPGRRVFAALTDVYRELTGVSDVELLKEFNQVDFIQGSTLAKKGVCLPLVTKWLTERNSMIDFFSDISTPEGREEIMHVAMAKVRTGNPGVNMDYLANKGYELKLLDDEAPVTSGLYSVTVILPDGCHGMGLEVTENNKTTFFDPNYGEFSFTNPASFHNFLPPYLKAAYDIKDEPNFSYVQYVEVR